MIWLWVVGIIVVVIMVVIWIISINNKLVREQVNVETALSDAKVVIDRRFKNIESTVNIMNQHNDKMKETLVDVMKLRQQNTISSYAEAEQGLNKVLSAMNVTLENYPEIGNLFDANEFMKLMAKHDRDVEMAKKNYNFEVEEFNTLIRTIPYSWFAGKYSKYDFWNVEDSYEKDNSNVKF